MKITVQYDISKKVLREWEEDYAKFPRGGEGLPPTSLLSGDRLVESLRMAGVRVLDFSITDSDWKIPRFVRLAMFEGFVGTFTFSEFTAGLAWIRQQFGLAGIRCSGFDEALRAWEESGQFLEKMSELRVLNMGRKTGVVAANKIVDDFEDAFLRFEEHEKFMTGLT